MAVRTIYLYGATSTGSPNFFGLASETAPSATANTTGWTVAKGTSGQFWRSRLGAGAAVASGTGQASSQIDSTTGPTKGTAASVTAAGDSFVFGPLTGTFANTAWTFNFRMIATVVSAQAGRMRCQVWKSANADGSSPTKLTSSTLVGSTINVTGTVANSTVTWSPGSLTLNNEYLFFQVEWNVTTASGSTTGNVLFNQTATAANDSTVVTPDLVVPDALDPTRLFDPSLIQFSNSNLTAKRLISSDSGNAVTSNATRTPGATAYYYEATFATLGTSGNTSPGVGLITTSNQTSYNVPPGRGGYWQGKGCTYKSQGQLFGLEGDTTFGDLGVAAATYGAGDVVGVLINKLLVTPTVWSSTDKSAGVNREAGALSASIQSPTLPQGIRANKAISSGQYFEASPAVTDFTAGGIGLANASQSLTATFNTANAIAYSPDGTLIGSQTGSGGASYTGGDMIGVHYTGTQVKFFKNGVLQYTVSTLPTGSLFAAASLNANFSRITANFAGLSPIRATFLALPSGATAYGDPLGTGSVYKNGVLQRTFQLDEGPQYAAITLSNFTAPDLCTVNFGATALSFLPVGSVSWDSSQQNLGYVGTADGSSTVSGVGASTATSVGTAAGSSTAAGIGASRATSTGTAAGSSTVSAVGQTIKNSVGTASGAGTAAATGAATATSIGTAAGSATASGVGASRATSVGTAAGSGTASAGSASTGTAAGSSTVSGVGTTAGVTITGVGTAAGSATAAGVGASLATAAGTAAGTSTASAGSASTGAAAGLSTASGVGASSATSVGSAAGSSTASATGAAVKPSVGTAAGSATATGVGASTAASVGTAAGSSTAQAGAASAGTASGIGSATGVGALTATSVGSAAGSSTAAATGQATKAGVGTAAGGSTASAVSAATSASVGSAAGSSTAAGAGASLATAVGTAAGSSSALAATGGLQPSVGSAAGSSTATGVGRSTPAAIGTAAGSSTAAATGAATAASVGSAAGTSTVSGVGAGASFAGVGTAAGAGTATGVGNAIIAAIGTAAGSSAVTAATLATKASVGTAAGAGTATAGSASTGTAAGAATVNGVGASTATSVGTAAGSSTATAVGATLSTGASTGSAAGVGTATGVGRSTAAAIGTAAGAGDASAVGQSTARSAGTAAGTATVAGVGIAARVSVGTAAGSSTATAVGRSTAASTGTAAGIGTASAVGKSTAASVGTAAGVGTAQATSGAIIRAVGTAAGAGIVVGVGKARHARAPHSFIEGSIAKDTAIKGALPAVAALSGSISKRPTITGQLN